MSSRVITVVPWGQPCPIRKASFQFALLCNGRICGHRLHAEEDRAGEKRWPFRGDDWMYSNDREAADAAARKLQSYLDSRPVIVPETRPNR